MPPAKLTYAVAGLSVNKSTVSYVCWHDPNTGYYATKMMECDGAHRFARLSRDRRLVEEAGFDVPNFGKPSSDFFSENKIEKRKLSLSTKHGITIGMTESAVIKKLGKPDRSTKAGKKKEYSAILYRYIKMDERENGSGLRNTYIFKSGKLIEILLNLDSIPVCGADGDPEEGWPWTQF